MKYKLLKVKDKLGNAYLPCLLVLFSIVLFFVIVGSVYQKNEEIKEGQLAEKTIRATKNIENTYETAAKKKLAAEAVATEYTYQEDIATTQHNRVEKLLSLITNTNDKLEKEYQEKLKKDDTTSKPTIEEKIASLKAQFESLDATDVAFYQKFSNTFYSLIFALEASDLETVKTETLNIIDDKMKDKVKEADLETIRQSAIEKIQFLDLSSNMQQIVRYLVNDGIVVNDFANEKKTKELKQAAMDAVSPSMIYQGEIIVREGTQIDSKAMEKLELLGMTNQSTSYSPIIALIFVIFFQLGVLLYFIKQVTEKGKRSYVVLFYVVAMTCSVILMKFFQIFQTEQMMYISLFFPAAFVPLVLNYFVSRRIGVMAAVFQVVFALLVFYDSIGTNYLTIIVMSYTVSGLFATLVRRIRINQQAMFAAFWVIIFPLFMNFILIIYQGMSLLDGKSWTMMICAFAGMLLSYLATVGLHPYIELLVTDDSVIALNELSNPSHPLLKKLLEEAPGTYHHSMMVASLSANAVAEIGGQSLLTRVACYYHDIGKIKHANFFVENLPAGAENPHNFLLPEDSKQLIFGHVLDGVIILEEYHMPKMVIDICRQHHGTTLMKFFYAKAKERNPEISEAEFRYPGPIPQTREAAVVSIADTCEAAVRAMDNPTNEKIRLFVKSVIKDRISDGQLDESGLTMNEIRAVEASLVSGLCSTFHSRIKYPKMKSEAEKMKEEQEKRDE